MARYKKQDSDNSSEDEKKEKKRSMIKSDAKRSIIAIFLFALTVLFVLGFSGSAGIIGNYLNRIAGLLFGWGKWLFPLVLSIGGVILLFRKVTFFYVSKLAGLGLAFVSVLGFFHIYFDKSTFLVLAQKGAGGGYAGYILSAVLIKLTGPVGGTVILFTLFLIGIIAAFNFSIVTLFQNLLHFRKKEEPVVPEAENLPAATIETLPPAEPLAAEIAKNPGLTGSENIKNIEFVEGPREKLLKKRISGADGNDKSKEKEKGIQNWILPSLELLGISNKKAKIGDIQGNAEIIQKTLGHFGIEVELGEVKTGPTITQYSFRPAVGIKLSKITTLNSNLALALAAPAIRIEAPIPGKSLVGIEVPNQSPAEVRLKELLDSETFGEQDSSLTIALGKDVNADFIFGNLEKMPHLMIAGSTGTGKSVCINSILLSLLYQNTPDDMQLILVDPKRVELSLYDGIPHLKSDKVIVENGKVINALKWAISEMEKRYKMLQDSGSRDILSYNQKAEAGQFRKYKDPEDDMEREEKMEKLPFIVIVIDELADLMVSHGKEVEGAIIRLAQMARAVGIHLIVSTQRPSVEVITGLIKANITTRIAFRVATQIDSRTILDSSGAEKLLGNGDMLYSSPNFSGAKRLQGVLVTEAEVREVVNHWKKQAREKGQKEITEDITQSSSQEKLDFAITPQGEAEKDALYEEAKNLVQYTGKASASFFQRRLSVGYSRAARILDELERDGIVGPQNGAKPREVFEFKGSNAEPEYEDSVDDQEKRDKWQM